MGLRLWLNKIQWFMQKVNTNLIWNFDKCVIRFLDMHNIGSFTEEQLMKLQNNPIDEFGVVHEYVV